jgi:hypothetical protein
MTYIFSRLKTQRSEKQRVAAAGPAHTVVAAIDPAHTVVAAAAGQVHTASGRLQYFSIHD